MPTLDGVHFARLARSNTTLPAPEVPIIMLSGHGDRWRVIEAARAGVNEYLLKPVSTKALRDRIVSILMFPRRVAMVDGHCTLTPRRPAEKAETGNRRNDIRQEHGDANRRNADRRNLDRRDVFIIG